MGKNVSSSRKLRVGDAAALPKRQTQAERRETTQAKVLESACRLFGSRGYADTSLKDIAVDLGLTITPIYHYFGNKQSLFLAVTEAMELEFSKKIENIGFRAEKVSPIEIWDILIEMTQQPYFAQIVLSDAPIVLGRERWEGTSVVKVVSRIFREQLSLYFKNSDSAALLSENDIALLQRMLMGCFTEAALMLAANPNYDSRPLILKILAVISPAH